MSLERWLRGPEVLTPTALDTVTETGETVEPHQIGFVLGKRRLLAKLGNGGNTLEKHSGQQQDADGGGTFGPV